MFRVIERDLKIVAPVVSIPVECSMDRMIARDIARRITGALGFSPAEQAQFGCVALTLVDLLLRTGQRHELQYHGLREGNRVGIKLSCEVQWVRNFSAKKVHYGLRGKFQHLVDEIEFKSISTPVIELISWTE
jgi:hypothetical protein